MEEEEEKKEAGRKSRGKREGGEEEGKGLSDDCIQPKVPTTLPLLSLRSVSEEDCRRQVVAGN